MDYEELAREYEESLKKLKTQNELIRRQREMLLEQSNTLSQQRDEISLLKQKAKTDPLTGLLNRTGMLEIIEELNDTYYSVVLCDIDDFKNINDTYGHAIGDIALQRVKLCADNIMRMGDYTGRFGGDEFLFILNGCTLENAKHKCEGLQEIIKIHSETHLGFSMSMSFGIAYHEPGMNYYDIREQADIALYKSKENGKGKINIYNENKIK